MRQVYSTAISWQPSPFGPVVICQTYPRVLFPEALQEGWPTDIDTASGFLREIGLEPGVALPSADDVAGFIFAGFNQRQFAYGRQSSELWKRGLQEGGELATWARQAASEAEIPIVASPLSASNLSGLASAGISLTAGGPAEVGQYLHYGGGVIFTGTVLVSYVAGWGLHALGRILFYRLHRATGTPLPPGFAAPEELRRLEEGTDPED